MENPNDGGPPLALNALLSAIDGMRSQLDEMEKQVRQIGELSPRSQLTPKQWLQLRGYKTSWDWIRHLERADEQLQAGYEYDEIVRIFKWQRKRTFLPVLAEFVKERLGR